MQHHVEERMQLRSSVDFEAEFVVGIYYNRCQPLVGICYNIRMPTGFRGGVCGWHRF